MLPEFKDSQDFDLFSHLLSDQLGISANKIRTAIARINHFSHVAAYRSAMNKSEQKKTSLPQVPPRVPESTGTLLPGTSVTFVLENGGSEKTHPIIGTLFDMASSPNLEGIYVSAVSRSNEIMRLELIESIVSDHYRGSDEQVDDIQTILNHPRIMSDTTLPSLGLEDIPEED